MYDSIVIYSNYVVSIRERIQDIYDEAGLTEGTHYEEVSSAASLTNSSCYTFASEPHTKPSQINSTIVNNVRNFVTNGGNFLAQCEGVEAYANSSNGSLLATFSSIKYLGLASFNILTYS